MLSLNKGRIFLYQVDKENKIVNKIYYNDKMGGKPDFTVEDGNSVLNDYDWKLLKQQNRLTQYDVQQLKKLIKTQNLDKVSNGLYINLYNKLQELIDSRISRSMIFDSKSDANLTLIPAIPKYNVIIAESASGGGKSTLLSRIIQVNMKKNKDEKVYLLTRRLQEPDPAFEPFWEDVIEVDCSDPENLPDIQDIGSNFVIVDDIESLPNQILEYVQEWINALLTISRKQGTRILYASHLISGFKHRYIMSEARWYYLFPHSNANKVKNSLRLKFNYSTAERNVILKKTREDKSRYVGLHLSNPAGYLTSKRIVLED